MRTVQAVCAERMVRLRQGRCPLHGAIMLPNSGWHYPITEAPYFEVACPSEVCSVRAKAYSQRGPWQLLPQWEYLLHDAITGPLHR